MNRVSAQLKTMRKTVPAKVFIVGCAAAGFHRGVTIKDRKLVVDRVAWGTLYAGLYTFGHPIVFYHMMRMVSSKTYSKRN